MELAAGYLQRGEELWLAGQCPHRVVDSLVRAVDLAPTAIDAWISLAFTHALSFNDGAAIVCADRARQLDARRPEPDYIRCWSIADRARKQGHGIEAAAEALEQAEAKLMRATTITPRLLLARLYALGRMTHRDLALQLCRDLLATWAWPDSYVLLAKACERIFHDFGETIEHLHAYKQIALVADRYPLICSWVVFNHGFSIVSRDASHGDLNKARVCFRSGLAMHDAVEHHESCNDGARYYAQLAQLEMRMGNTAAALTTVGEGCNRFPLNANLFHIRAFLLPSSKLSCVIHDLYQAHQNEPNEAHRINTLLATLFESDERDQYRDVLGELLDRGLRLHGGLSNCLDSTFLALYAEGSRCLGRDRDALRSSDRQLRLTMQRAAIDDDRIFGYETRERIYRDRFQTMSLERRLAMRRLAVCVTANDHGASLREAITSLTVPRDQGWHWQDEPINDNGKTLLTMAASSGAAAATETLLQLVGTNVDQIDGKGCSAAIIACKRGYWNVITVLASFGSRLDFRDATGRTPLEAAELCGRSKCEMRKLEESYVHGARLCESRRDEFETVVYSSLLAIGARIDVDSYRYILSFIGRENYVLAGGIDRSFTDTI